MPYRCPAAEPGRHWGRGQTTRPAGGACLLCRLSALPLVCFSAPILPTPFPSGEGGDYKFILPGATAPGTPALNRLRHLQTLPSRHRRGTCFRRRQFAAKPIELPFHEQCRQPRRGGTGGEELRRLRWSSPPGQVEQVPGGLHSLSLAAPAKSKEPVSGGQCRCRSDYPLCVISRDPAYPATYCPQRSRTRWSDHGSTRALRHRPTCRPAGSGCRTSPARCRRFSAEAQDPSQSP